MIGRLALVLVLASGCGSKDGATPEPTGVEIDRARAEAEQARLQAAEAEQAAAQASTDANESRDAVMRLDAELAELTRNIDAAVDDVVAAQSDAERESAKAQLQQLQQDRHELEQRIADAKKKEWVLFEQYKADSRKRGGPPDCTKNPLAKGCM